MSRDEVRLEVGGKSVTDFISYEVTANIFAAAGSFKFELANSSVDVKEGARARLYVNGRLEMVGIVDIVEDSYDKSSSSLTVSGRDYMGLLIDSGVTSFNTLDGRELKELAAELLKDTPFVNRSSIIYGKGTRTDMAETAGVSFDVGMIQPRPGESIFDVLKRPAMARGLRFYVMPNGDFVFGRPRTSGRAEFRLVRRLNGRGNNIKAGRRIKNISKAHSHITVIGQMQGHVTLQPGALNLTETLENKDVPYYKPCVIEVGVDGITGAQEQLKEAAARELERERFEALKYEYTVAGHSQNGRNYQPNAICHVLDEQGKLRQDTNRLIYGRTLLRNKEDGTQTKLSLSRLGVVPA